VLQAMGRMSKVVFHPCSVPCEVCGDAVGDRMLEGLLVCASCAEALTEPAPSYETLAQARKPHPSLTQVVDTLLRDEK
jgi:hypothetical protein